MRHCVSKVGVSYYIGLAIMIGINYLVWGDSFVKRLLSCGAILSRLHHFWAVICPGFLFMLSHTS